MRLRHPHNSNLTLTYDSNWRGLPVLTSHGPLIREYLDAILGVMSRSLEDHPRTFGLRFDLHFPEGWPYPEGQAISQFNEALKSRIEADLRRRQRRRKDGRELRCRIRFVWVKEQYQSNSPHYHLFVFLNRDAYFSLGRFHGREHPSWEDMPEEPSRTNMAERIHAAWASALGLPPAMVRGLVHFPLNCCYWLDVNAPGFEGRFKEAFFRASYFAKVDTKQYGDGSNKFGCSRG